MFNRVFQLVVQDSLRNFSCREPTGALKLSCQPGLSQTGETERRYARENERHNLIMKKQREPTAIIFKALLLKDRDEY